MHTNGSIGHEPATDTGGTSLQGQAQIPPQLMPQRPQAPLAAEALVARHTHGAVTDEHLDYYLDQFTFRYNRERSRSRGKLFYRLAQRAVAVDPTPYESLVKYARFTS